SCAVLFAGVTSPEELMDDKDLESRTEMSHSRSRREFLYAVGGAGIVSAAGLASMGAQRSATKIDHRRSQMESPIEVVRRFCAAWSDNIGAPSWPHFSPTAPSTTISRWRRSPAGRPSRTTSP